MMLITEVLETDKWFSCKMLRIGVIPLSSHPALSGAEGAPSLRTRLPSPIAPAPVMTRDDNRTIPASWPCPLLARATINAVQAGTRTVYVSITVSACLRAAVCAVSVCQRQCERVRSVRRPRCRCASAWPCAAVPVLCLWERGGCPCVRETVCVCVRERACPLRGRGCAAVLSVGLGAVSVPESRHRSVPRARLSARISARRYRRCRGAGRPVRARRLSPGNRRVVAVAVSLRVAAARCPPWLLALPRPAPPARAARRALSAVLKREAAALPGSLSTSPELRRAPRAPRLSGVTPRWSSAASAAYRAGDARQLLPWGCDQSIRDRAPLLAERAENVCAYLLRAAGGDLEVPWEKGDSCRGMPCCRSHGPARQN